MAWINEVSDRELRLKKKLLNIKIKQIEKELLKRDTIRNRKGVSDD